MRKLIHRCLFSFFSAVLITGCSAAQNNKDNSSRAIEAINITSFPEQIDTSCRGGRAKIFDECSNQTELFTQSKIRAKTENKTVLVSYGAEWCIWCHVFDAYINGDVSSFTYTYGEPGSDERYTHTMYERAKNDVSQQAYDLKKYVSENFVVAHIDYEHSPDGDDVLSITQAWDDYDGSIPYIFTVDESGKYAAKSIHDEAEVRRDTDDWYRGYDRVKLLQQLKNMRNVAIENSGMTE